MPNWRHGDSHKIPALAKSLDFLLLIFLIDGRLHFL